MRQILIALLCVSAATAQDPDPNQSGGFAKGPLPDYPSYEDRIPVIPYNDTRVLTESQKKKAIEQGTAYENMSFHDKKRDRPFLWMMTNYDLADELELSTDQLARLSALDIPSPFSARQEVLWGKDFPVSDAVFEDFVKRFPLQLRREAEASNEKVREILDESQFARLKQLFFQLNVFVSPKLHAALRTHGESLPNNEATRIAAELKRLRKTKANDKRLVELVLWKETLSKIYGKDKVEKWMGEPLSDREFIEDVSEVVKSMNKKNPTKVPATRRQR